MSRIPTFCAPILNTSAFYGEQCLTASIQEPFPASQFADFAVP
jgi:hypothetical protein